jgi:hypothetical protein
MRLSLAMGRSLGFASAACNSSPYSDSLSLRLRAVSHLTSLHTCDSPAHYAKGTPSPSTQQGVNGRVQMLSPPLRPLLSAGLRPLVGTRFQVLFHSRPRVLFTFPSRYCFTIGCQGVFSLGRWSSLIPTGFLVPHGTWVPTPGSLRCVAYRPFTFSGASFQMLPLHPRFVSPRPPCAEVRIGPATPLVQRTQASAYSRFRLVPVRSPLLGESRLLSLPGGTEMFQFSPFAPSTQQGAS